MASHKKLKKKAKAPKTISHCTAKEVHQKLPVKVKERIPTVLRRISDTDLPYTPAYEKKINDILYRNKTFYQYRIEPLDEDLEVKVWEIIVRRCKEFPELVYMLSDLDVLMDKKYDKRPAETVLDLQFKHQRARRDSFKRYFLREGTNFDWKVDDQLVTKERISKGLKPHTLSSSQRKKAWDTLQKAMTRKPQINQET